MKEKNKYFKRLVIFAIVTTLVFSTVPFIKPIEADGSTEKLLFDFSFEKPIIDEVTLGSKIFNRINMGDLETTDIVGEPRMPVKPLQVLLPPNSDVDSIVVEGNEKLLSGSFIIEPGQEPIPISDMNQEGSRKTVIEGNIQISPKINEPITVNNPTDATLLNQNDLQERGKENFILKTKGNPDGIAYDTSIYGIC